MPPELSSSVREKDTHRVIIISTVLQRNLPGQDMSGRRIEIIFSMFHYSKPDPCQFHHNVRPMARTGLVCTWISSCCVERKEEKVERNQRICLQAVFVCI